MSFPGRLPHHGGPTTPIIGQAIPRCKARMAGDGRAHLRNWASRSHNPEC